MKLYVGMDVSLEETSLCIVDSEGVTVREVKVSTEPEAIRCALDGSADRLDRVGVVRVEVLLPAAVHAPRRRVEPLLDGSVRDLLHKHAYLHISGYSLASLAAILVINAVD